MIETMVVVFISLSFGILLIRIIGRTKGSRDPIIEYYKNNDFKAALRFAEKELTSPQLDNKKKALRQYDMAVCYNRMGEFQNALDVLQELDIISLQKEYHQEYNSLFAFTLMMLKKSRDTAIGYIGKTREFNRYKRHRNLYLTNYLVMAQIDLDRKEEDSADVLIIEVIRQRTLMERGQLSDYIYKRMSAAYYELQENYLLGLFYLRMRDDEEAATYMNAVVKAEVPCYMTTKAKEFMAKYDGPIGTIRTIDDIRKEIQARKAERRNKK